MSTQAQAFLQRWRQQDAAFALATVYDRSGRLTPALGLYFELAEIHYRLSERRLAESKLGWWLEEAAALRAGQPRHPLTQALQAQGQNAPAVALIGAMGRSFEDRTPADRAHLMQARRQHLSALAALTGEEACDAALAGLDDCFRLASLGQGGADLNWPVSLAERARWAISREQLAGDPVRAADLRRQQAREWLGTLELSAVAPALAVQVGLWRQALLRNGLPPRAGPPLAWRSWRLARRARRG